MERIARLILIFAVIAGVLWPRVSMAVTTALGATPPVVTICTGSGLVRLALMPGTPPNHTTDVGAADHCPLAHATIGDIPRVGLPRPVVLDLYPTPARALELPPAHQLHRHSRAPPTGVFSTLF